MEISIVTPGVKGVVTGNRRSSEDFEKILRDLGHHVVVSPEWYPNHGDVDLLIALHAGKSAVSIERYRADFPDRPMVLVLTGTDIYPNPEAAAVRSMQLADKLVALQDRAPAKVPEDLRSKVEVIPHSAAPSGFRVRSKSVDPFEICVAGHLRDVKDPMQAAWASRLLPESSKLRIVHVGAILEEKYKGLVEREIRGNPRYVWHDGMQPDSLKRLMATCQLSVVSSLSEGGARIVGESIVDGTPVLSSKIDGVVGLLGEDYPGFFPVGDTGALAELMSKVETDSAFRSLLSKAAELAAPKFDPSREENAWAKLISQLKKDS